MKRAEKLVTPLPRSGPESSSKGKVRQAGPVVLQLGEGQGSPHPAEQGTSPPHCRLLVALGLPSPPPPDWCYWRLGRATHHAQPNWASTWPHKALVPSCALARPTLHPHSPPWPLLPGLPVLGPKPLPCTRVGKSSRNIRVHELVTGTATPCAVPMALVPPHRHRGGREWPQQPNATLHKGHPSARQNPREPGCQRRG